MKKETCERCLKEIDLKKDWHVLLGTYAGEKVVQEVFFHSNCWRLHFEEKARQKAEAVMQGVKQKMFPMAKKIVSHLIGGKV